MLVDSSRGDLKSHKNQFSRELRRTEIDLLISESRKRMIEESKKVPAPHPAPPVQRRRALRVRRGVLQAGPGQARCRHDGQSPRAALQAHAGSHPQVPQQLRQDLQRVLFALPARTEGQVGLLQQRPLLLAQTRDRPLDLQVHRAVDLRTQLLLLHHVRGRRPRRKANQLHGQAGVLRVVHQGSDQHLDRRQHVDKPDAQVRPAVQDDAVPAEQRVPGEQPLAG